MDDPDFWRKVLGEEAGNGQGSDDEMGGGEIYYNEDGLPMQMRRCAPVGWRAARAARRRGGGRRDARSPGATSRLARVLGECGGAAKGGKSDQWSRAQLTVSSLGSSPLAMAARVLCTTRTPRLPRAPRRRWTSRSSTRWHLRCEPPLCAARR